MATIVASRKRSASPFLDEAFPAPPHLAKRVRRFTRCAAVVAPPPPQSSSSREAAAPRISRATAATDNGAGMDECAAVLVEQMAGASDLADAKNIASWILGIFKDAVAERAAAAGLLLREENNSLRAQAASASSLKEENSSLKAHAAQSSAEIAKLREEVAATKAQAAALERDNAVLKRGVVLLNARQEETVRAAAEMKKKAAELEMANYALTLRLRDADTCRFQAFHNNAF
ncbi:hypothetical protein QOZ80_4BG0338440 [Eleusine coracana subsp. coracana]|nr:hypothetical protein QOZ80_4BG0338440 [Eleusine coracana subsp. coracana]